MQRAGSTNLPAKAAQLGNRMAEWVNANFVGRRKKRTRIESLIKQELRRAIDGDPKVVLGAIRVPNCFCNFVANGDLRGSRKRWQIQSVIQPDAASHPRTCPLASNFKRFESDDEG